MNAGGHIIHQLSIEQASLMAVVVISADLGAIHNTSLNTPVDHERIQHFDGSKLDFIFSESCFVFLMFAASLAALTYFIITSDSVRSRDLDVWD